MQFSRIQTLSILSIISFAFTGCSTNHTFTESKNPKPARPLRLAFITCVVNARFFEPVKKGVNDAAEMMGVQCDFIGTEGVDIQKQAAMVTQAVKDGYDGIALNIIDPVVFDEVMQLTLYLRYGIMPSDIDAGTAIINKSNVEQVIELTKQKYR